VHVNNANRMLAAYEKARRQYPGLVFGIMFQQRTYTYWRKVKELIDSGALGKLVRATWIITDWFRTQAYYANGGWRATWRGEGGGVLLNQCPHNLDLYQWFFGLPQRITGIAAIGKYHDIEVEDEVTAFFEHANGMVGHFITTTSESPGTNRLEIVGELGRLVFENGKLSFGRNARSMLDFIRTSPNPFDRVECRVEDVPFEPQTEIGHASVIRAFAAAVLEGGSPLVQAAEGIRSLSLSNGIMLSHFLQGPVELPLDADAYEARLLELARSSRFKKDVKLIAPPDDQTASFGIYKKG
jgi:predicted dehydrogenase